MDTVIKSLSNPKVKDVLSLIKSNQKRKKEKLIIVEGVKETEAAINAGYIIKTCFICRAIFKNEAFEKKIFHIEITAGKIIFEVAKPVYEAMAYREAVQGLIAVFEEKELILDNIKLSKYPLIIVLESIEKPGNLGAVLRTADACGADAVIVCEPKADVFNPNVVRSSVGCIFYTPLAVASSSDTIKWLKDKGVCIVCTALPATQFYYNVDFRKPTAIIMGSEDKGLSDIWFKNADALIKIPMLGKTDSLNVSVSAAITVFEAVRQRDLNK